jgi:hypothetical protein
LSLPPASPGARFSSQWFGKGIVPLRGRICPAGRHGRSSSSRSAGWRGLRGRFSL